MNDIEFSEYILREVGVAACPGSFFGKNGEGYVRFCFANSMENIKDGINRLKVLFNAASKT